MVVGAVESGADAVGELLGGQEAGRFGDAALGVEPLGLDRHNQQTCLRAH